MLEHVVINDYRSKKLRAGYLVTVDSGKWVFLSNEEWLQLQNKNFGQELFSKLENAGILLSHNSSQQYVENYRKRYAHMFQGTSLHIMVVTLRCNLACKYCHSSVVGCNDFSKDMSIETAKKTVDFIFQSPSGAITIEFQGGEPTLNLAVIKFVVDYAREKNKFLQKDLRFALVSNLQFMGGDTLDYLMNEDIGLCTSLDGPKEVHDKNRGVGSYDRVTKWIDVIKNKYGKDLNAILVITKYSLPYPKEIVDEYIKWGFRTIQLKAMNKLGYAKNNWDKLNYSVEEFVQFWKKAMGYILENYSNISETITTIMLRKILLNQSPMFTELESPCGGIIGQMAYDIDGSIFTCDEGRNYEEFKLGDVANDDYKKILSSEQTTGFLQISNNDSLLCDSCVYKPFCGLCPVCQFAEQGNVIPILSMNSRCRILLEQFKYIFEHLDDVETKTAFNHWIKRYREF